MAPIGRPGGNVDLGWMKDALRRLLALEVIDRSLVVGAQAFSALIPLMIVLASVFARSGDSFADSLVERLELRGAGAAAVRRAVAAPADEGTLSVVGALLVVASALAFTRALQRTFEVSWDLPRRGLRSTGWGLIWLAAFAAYWALFPVIHDALPPGTRFVVGLAGSFALWLVTPYLLLARRIPWRRLTLQAALTACGMTALSAGAALYVPRAMSASAQRFGSIGVAFTLLSVLWAAGFVLVTAAVLGAFIGRPPGARDG